MCMLSHDNPNPNLNPKPNPDPNHEKNNIKANPISIHNVFSEDTMKFKKALVLSPQNLFIQ